MRTRSCSRFAGSAAARQRTQSPYEHIRKIDHAQEVCHCGGSSCFGDTGLSGCGSEAKDGTSGTSSSPQTSPSTSSAIGDFNDADATFATSMIPHHRQAVEMAELAERRAASPQVKALATKIKEAQDPEIQTMSEWLTSWGKPAPDDMTAMDMSGSMPGMMSLTT